jgi:3-methyladenine DNA glycosylase AlkC
MGEYTTRPSQFRLPPWAQQFLAEESVATGVTKTDVVLEALSTYRRKRLDQQLEEGYRECAEAHLAEVRGWDPTLMDGLEDEDWGQG